MSSNVVGQVKELEESRWAAMMTADIDRLDALLNDRVTWIHSSGQCEGKKEFLERMAAGRVTYLSIERTGECRAHGDQTVVITGLVQMRVLAEGQEHELKNRYTNIWVRERQVWQMVGWQSTAVVNV
ncbi:MULTISPECIES: nuclear transport factor 2 family protein [Burkholderia]|uniref:nuclear transport factor 2 family protein n=1 Tax=Burkholderia TaxID=32008 RepID=UPI0009B574B5|nr:MULTISPECIES: nuclear transport factor 2 family protein [Burkholderia]RQS24173.1 nuclear transport factor 2 family protein [Burkholderia sp. Bp8995]RQS38902.1 nuclear transport factor 2 family protein [Burkholderia sp. Bp8989]